MESYTEKPNICYLKWNDERIKDPSNIIFVEAVTETHRKPFFYCGYLPSDKCHEYKNTDIYKLFFDIDNESQNIRIDI